MGHISTTQRTNNIQFAICQEAETTQKLKIGPGSKCQKIKKKRILKNS